MKRLANDIGDIISGRAVHPITPVPGGFTRIPTAGELAGIRKRLVEEAMPDVEATVGTMKSLADAIPDFIRETEFIALSNDHEYAMYDGSISSTDVGLIPQEDYLQVTNEFIVPHSTSKHTRNHRSSYMVGALARFNNNHDKLCREAAAAASELGLKAPCFNPYMNTIAQVAEVAHAVVDSIRIIDTLLDNGLVNEVSNPAPTKYGTVIGVTEVPGGILFHEYTYDRQGRIIMANCIIPTGQNLQNIDDDMKKLVPEIVEKPKEKIVHDLEMLVRAYDPCISCSVHIVDVDFIG